MRRRIEEERRRKAWATTSYLHAYQQAEETTVRAHTQEAMEVDALVSAAGNGGVKRKTEEGNIGVEDSHPKRAKTAACPATALMTGGIEPAEPLKR
jgi:hypothetical protein